MSLLPLLRRKERKGKGREGKERKLRKEGRKAASLMFVGQSEPAAATSTVIHWRSLFLCLSLVDEPQLSCSAIMLHLGNLSYLKRHVL
jgi:hypothetical protein